MSFTLDYASPSPKTATQFRLDEADGVTTLTFPLLPKWVNIFNLCGTSLVAIVGIADIILPFWLSHSIRASMNTLPGSSVIMETPPASYFAAYVIKGMSMCAVAIFGAVSVARRTRIPVVLQIKSGCLIYSKPFAWWTRTREWPVERIKGMELQPIKDIFRRGCFARLIVKFDSGWRKYFVIRSKAPEFPAEVLAAFSDATGYVCQQAPDSTANSKAT